MKRTDTEMTYRVSKAARNLAAGALLAAGIRRAAYLFCFTVLLAGTARGQSLLAEGGDSSFVTNLSGTIYGVHLYTNTTDNAQFTPDSYPLTVGYLVVAGGGMGSGGGGGAGGLLTGTTNISAGPSITIQVGGGGSGVSGTDRSIRGGNGTNSVFGSFTAFGGGGGGSGNNIHGLSGGSGGGGAGTNGLPGIASGGGNGGTGVYVNVILAGLRLGDTNAYGWFAGGGGGQSFSPGTQGTGGKGGGGAQGKYAQPNTGGGGGGQNDDPSPASLGNGGSGIVVVWYEIPVPTITVGSTSNGFGTVFVNTTNTITNTVAGIALSDNITVTVTPYSDFQISTDNVNFVSSYTLTQTDGTVPTTTNYVRFTPTTAGPYNGAITNVSGSVTQVVTLTGTAINPQPILTVPTVSLNLGNVITNKTSTNFTYTLSGSLLEGAVTATVYSAYFAVSTNEAGPFGQSVILTTNAPGTVRNSLIAGNLSRNAGGGISGGIVENCTIVDNESGLGVGGVYGSTVSNSIVYNNKSNGVN